MCVPIKEQSVFYFREDRLGSITLVSGHYLEIQTYSSHGNRYYMYLKSISDLLYMNISYDIKISYSGYLDLQAVIGLVTYAIFGFLGFLGPYNNCTHAITQWFQGMAQRPSVF
jgi:hypothetical protein